jgi:hypothetical protein
MGPHIMSETLGWHRRHAIHIVSELPDNTADALKVLALAKEVVERFLEPPHEVLQETRAPALSLVKAARNLSLSDTGKPPSSPS